MSSSQKISQFNVLTSLLDTAQIVVVSGGQNYTIPFSTFKSILGVTGTLESTGDVAGTPILNVPVSGEYEIRNLEDGNGIAFGLSGSDGISASLALTQDATGTALIENLSTATPDVASLVAGTDITLSKTGQAITINSVINGIGAASAGDVFIADGAGGSTWSTLEDIKNTSVDAGYVLTADGVGGASFSNNNPSGWASYKDNATAQTFNTTPKKLSVNGLGSSTETGYLPIGVSELWDTTGNKITPVNVGDTYSLRIDLPISNVTGSASELTLQLDIGGGATPTVVIVERQISISAGSGSSVSVSFGIFSLATFVANGGQLFLSTDANSADVTAPSIFIDRISKGN
jgi:hypothetical protein